MQEDCDAAREKTGKTVDKLKAMRLKKALELVSEGI